MENYVLMYYFENNNVHRQFEEKVKSEFPRHRIDDEIDSLQYFGFAGRGSRRL